jgi:hypothetical protein
MASNNTVVESDVENFFKNLTENASAGASRAQKRRLVESASALWRGLVSGGAAQAGGGSTGASATSFRAAKELGTVLGLTTHPASGLMLRPRSLAMPATVEIGKTTLSEAERWKLQAALRREETKASGEKYNQSMLRETRVAKPPTPGESFPAGRGKPVPSA